MKTHFVLYCNRTMRTQFRITVSDVPLPTMEDPSDSWWIIGIYGSADAITDALASHLKMAETL